MYMLRDKFHSDAPDQIYQKAITVPAVPEVLVQANSTHTFTACT